ncbi:MAG: hypothetical protein CL927_14005 [Deltaproteobacteria bacterium]|nr:hypothetical protein [Deltaproteobacteria bacterium]HCH65891.1 hypothetical protein [Deltaproteobacteria bacterium]
MILALVLGGLHSGPVHAREAPSVCQPLVADVVDPVAVRAVLSENPSSLEHLCKVRRSALGEAGLTTLFVVSGLALIPGALDSAKYARHTPLELAILRDSRAAARALVKAGADPTHGSEKASPLTLAVMRDLDAGSTDWTELVLMSWSGPLLSDALSATALDRLFFAPELTDVLGSSGMRGHGLAEDGTIWLHRALIQDWPLPKTDDALVGQPLDGVQVKDGELPRYEETLAPGARFYEETVPRLSVAAVMARGVPIGHADSQGRTALYYAAYTGNWTAYERLLAAGAKPLRAGARPESILFALAAGGSTERFEATLRLVLEHRDGDLTALRSLAGSLVDPEPVGWCRQPAEMRPSTVECDAVPDQATSRRLLASMGVSPPSAWWQTRMERGRQGALQLAIESGFIPPMGALKTAVRRKNWKTTRMLVRDAVLSPAEARRLARMASLRGAPAGVQEAIAKARVRAEKAQ